MHTGGDGELSKARQAEIQVELDGVAGDSHRSYTRKTWAGDKQAKGTVRRNERQWSAVSEEELADISKAMDLKTPITAAQLGANLCLRGVGQLSRLPKGTMLIFPSGAELMVEEYNPPCRDMGEYLAKLYTTVSGKELSPTAFSKAATLTRGIVGVVEVAGTISEGDKVDVRVYTTPAWLERDLD